MISIMSAAISEALLVLAQPQRPSETDVVVAALDGPTGDSFLAAVVEHRLHGALFDVLRRVDRSVPEHLRLMVDDDRLTRLRIGGLLARAGASLDAADIPWLTFKGPVISSLMDRPEFRSFNDLDLLVDVARFGRALDVLTGEGIEEINHNWDPYIEHRVGEVPMVSQGTSIDLHWHLIALRRTRRTIRLDPGPILDRRRAVSVGDLEVPTLDVVDQLLHFTLHAALAGANRLDQLRDITTMVQSEHVDWDDLIVRARAAGVARLIAHPLDRARSLTAADIPLDVIDAMGGRTLTLRRSLDRRGVLRGGFVTSVWRDSWAATARVGSMRMADRVAAVAGRGPAWDFTNPDSTLYHATVSGGADARAEYLRLIQDWS